jgi:hypothetical protein
VARQELLNNFPSNHLQKTIRSVIRNRDTCDVEVRTAPPLCNPCDHPGPPGDPRNYHDHVLDSIPSDPGQGEFNALWHVFAIRPANSLPATQAAYAARLPMMSEAAVDAAIAAGVAQEIDTGSYFLCSIVNAHAAP